MTYSSTYVLVALSIDRYDAIKHPMKFSGSCKYQKMDKCQIFIEKLELPVYFEFFREAGQSPRSTCLDPELPLFHSEHSFVRRKIRTRY